MANSERYPGVYIEEVNHFAVNVIPVETSVPVFIGYTEIATNLVAHDRHLIPTRIASLPEYQRLFGRAQLVIAVFDLGNDVGHRAMLGGGSGLGSGHGILGAGAFRAGPVFRPIADPSRRCK